MSSMLAGALDSYCPFEKAVQYADLLPILKISLIRIHSWPTPRNWSANDWFRETENVATTAAWQAASEYRQPTTVTFSCFVQSRILSRTRTRYRQEYMYSLRYCVIFEESTESGDQTRNEFKPRLYQEPSIQPRSYFDLTEAVANLSNQQRHVIEELFFNGNTEAQLATSLGISQRAINKRKQAALNSLRELLKEK